MIDHFQAFNITSIHREKNHILDSLTATTSMFTPRDPKMPNSFKVVNLYRPIVSNNEEALLIFENDEQAHFFFMGSKEEEEDQPVKHQKVVSNQEKILILKNNYFLEDLVSLEEKFMRNYGAKVEIPRYERSVRKVQET